MELPAGGILSGRVTEEVGGNPLAGVMVCAGRGWEERDPVCAPTDAAGKYEIVGLFTDEYTVKFSPTHGLQYFGERYDDQILGNGHIQTLVPVSAGGTTANLNSALKPAVEVQGVVTVAATGRPLTYILVCIAPFSSFFDYSFADESKCSRTGGSGSYSIGGLEAGLYTVLFSPELRDYIHYIPPLDPEPDGYPTRFWREQASLEAADNLALTAPNVVTGIDARLGPPPVLSPSLPPAATPSVHKRKKCKSGRRLTKVKGKRRCVRKHRGKRKGQGHRSSPGTNVRKPLHT